MNMQNVASRTTYIAAKMDTFGQLEPHNTVTSMRDAAASKTNMTAQQVEQIPYEVPAKNELKIVVAGNVGSGKSTSIRAISEIPVIGTEAKATESDALHRKSTTTTSMESSILSSPAATSASIRSSASA